MQDHAISDVNWDAGPVLSTEIFTASVVYDALSRPVTSTDPGGNITVPAYDKSGALVKVVLNGTEHVQNIKYDAKGQRQSILYGNNTVTKYTYDANTFRLKTLLTTGNSGATIYQGLNYYYDPVGNITTITDSAQQTLYFNNTVVSPTQKYTYDALYRLIKAQGRELIGTASFGTDDNTQDTAWKTTHKGDGNAVQSYTQNYTYDAVGNILTLQHIAGTGSYTRTFNIGTANNRLTSTVVGANTYNYTHDVRGNISVMPHLSTMGWNQQNELKNIAKGTMSAWYQYGGGQRIRKYVNKAGIKEERIYLGNYEIYRKFDASSLKIVERITLHVSDDTGRIAMLENRTFGTPANDNNTAPSLMRYIYSNHLQSASLELNHLAEIVSYEEYHPYGTTSYQAMNASIQAVAKRYRYTGKERDEESGLYYHGARYYIPWLCRWVSVDPINSEWYNLTKGKPKRNVGRTYVEMSASPYEYSYDNPIVYNDPSGEQPPQQKDAHNQPKLKKETVEQVSKLMINISAGIAGVPLLIPNDSEAINKDKGQEEQSSETITPIVRKLLNSMYSSEGGYVNRSDDPGGATKYGIAEKREWPQAAKLLGLSLDIENIKNLTTQQADKYYVASRLEPYSINKIQNEKIANAIFDQSVLTPGIINKNIKKALNDLGYQFKVNSSKLNEEQINSLNTVNADKLVEKFADHQLEYYESLKGTEVYRVNIKGWKNRLNSIKKYE